MNASLVVVEDQQRPWNTPVSFESYRSLDVDTHAV